MSGLVAAGCLVGFSAVRLTSGYSSFVQLGADVTVTLLVYALAWLVIPAVRQDIHDVVEIASMMRHRAQVGT